MFSSKIQRQAKSKMRKRQLFHATDFQSLMYPCFTFYRILGMFPYKINASIFETSKPHYVMSTVIVCVCCVFKVVFIRDIIISKINLGDITRNLEAICYNMYSGFIVTITHVLSGPRMRSLQTISEISSKLSSESYQKLSKLIYIKDILGVIFLIVQIITYNFIKQRIPETNYLTIIIAVLETYFFVLVFHINMLHINCVCVLKACFKSINDSLAHIQILMTNDVKSRDLRLIHRVQKNRFLLRKLKILKKWHLMVSDAVKMLNTIFSLQLLAVIAVSFSNITFQVYFHAVRWQDGVFINIDAYFLVTFLTSVGYYIIIISLLVWACETGKNQAQEISTTVHDVLNRANNKQIKNELQLFSLQILHHENTFSAKGVTVDATLLTAMVGYITTHLLIFIQFLNASHSCDRKTAINVI
ncbi:uncharacterized protein [Temnothorax longispinosus]|uniref:uncharacterized protein n=1 Tax=Temnothorax longispinosus TaxID=300112 RepID=UPI003A98FF52